MVINCVTSSRGPHAQNKRNRKPNFTAAECALICEAAEQNLAVIKTKFSTTLTNKNKTKVWEDITTRVNSLGVCLRSVAEVKDKWRGMVSAAKREHTQCASSQRKTGGGEKPASPKSSTKKIIDLFGDDPTFSGIDGGWPIETLNVSLATNCIHKYTINNLIQLFIFTC